jgi:hypothetical protein
MYQSPFNLDKQESQELNPKSQIPNKSQIQSTNDQNARAGQSPHVLASEAKQSPARGIDRAPKRDTLRLGTQIASSQRSSQ